MGWSNEMIEQYHSFAKTGRNKRVGSHLLPRVETNGVGKTNRVAHLKGSGQEGIAFLPPAVCSVKRHGVMLRVHGALAEHKKGQTTGKVWGQVEVARI